MDGELGQARHDCLLRWGQLVDAGETRGVEHLPECLGHLGRGVCARLARARWAPRAPSASAAVLHCMTLGMISSNVMSG